MRAFMRKWFPTAEDYPEGRLFSLDLLRGLDMLLLTVIAPLVCAAQHTFGCFPESVMRQLTHPWGGFTLYDIIMPLFIFMCGAAIPFALGRRLKAGKAVFWRHVIGRVVLLWVLGGCVQGNWLTLDPKTFSPFANTLQSIAIGYLATAAMMTVPCRWFQIVLPIALALVYTVAMGGDYSQFGNLAQRIDHAILSALLPPENPYVAQPSYYTWFLTSLMFAAMTMAGYHATNILVASWEKRRKAVALFIYGGALLAVGWAATPWVPMIKQVFSLSFTAQAMGWSVLALAILYVVTDIWRIRRGTAVILLFGQFALAAYLGKKLFGGVLLAFANLAFGGVDRLLGNGGDNGLFLEVVVTIELIAVVAIWRHLKTCGRKD